MNIDTLVLTVFYFLPAIIANASPPIFSRLKFIQPIFIPISVRLFGKHKTWGGLICGINLASITSLLQNRGYEIGLILGIGALSGDLIKSYFKRRYGIKEGHYIPFDTIDWIIGAITSGFIYEISLRGDSFLNHLSDILNKDPWLIITVPLFFTLGTLIVDYFAYKLKFKNSL